MKLRLTGTEAECARLTFLLRFGPPDLDVVQVSPPLSQPPRPRPGPRRPGPPVPRGPRPR